MRADKVMELARLHGVYVAGAFNWRTIRQLHFPWMLRFSEAHMAEADPNLNPNACGADGYTSDDLAELGEADLAELCEANGCSEGLCTEAEFQAQVQAQAQATEWADSMAEELAHVEACGFCTEAEFQAQVQVQAQAHTDGRTEWAGFNG